jgi:hypothetical protein
LWSSSVATLLILVGLLGGFLIYYVGLMVRSSRRADTYIGGRQEMPMHRVRATAFYNTIRDLPFLAGTYRTQEKGHLDPFLWFGNIGKGVTWLLQQLHPGILPRYLSYSLLGIVLLLLFLAIA